MSREKGKHAVIHVHHPILKATLCGIISISSLSWGRDDLPYICTIASLKDVPIRGWESLCMDCESHEDYPLLILANV